LPLLNYNLRMSNTDLKPIAYTLGDPAGIGADVFIKYAIKNPVDDIVVVGDESAFKARAQTMAADIPKCEFLHCSVGDPSVCGSSSVINVDGIIAMLNAAIDGCLSSEFSAMVTGPLSKSLINDAGIAFTGHTEYLAERCQADLPVMLLATKPSEAQTDHGHVSELSSQLRVALATTHLPLSAVSDAISVDSLSKVIRILDKDLRAKFSISEPRILVCGLNPHAGEGGHLGREELEVISPALEALRKNGLNLIGPVPADTAFTPQMRATADVILAMYHDQGLPPLKALGFGEAANITLGLPIIRTSVDHGTAYDLAGTGKADEGGLATAIEIARAMATLSFSKSAGLAHG